MKIALIIRKLSIRGGSQRQALSLAVELKLRGHDITVYTLLLDATACYTELINQIKVVVLDKQPRLGRLPFISQFIYENESAKRLAEIIDRDTDVINPHDPIGYKTATYFKKNIARVPSVYMMNDLPTRRFVYARAVAVNENLKISALKKAVAFILDKVEYLLFLKCQDVVVVLDHRDKEWVKKFFDKEARVVRTGVTIEEFDFTPREILSEEKDIRILTTGIFFEHRRFEDILEAIVLLKKRGYNITFTIIGDTSHDPQYHKKILALIKRLSLDSSVKILGRVDSVVLKQAYKSSTVFVFASHLQSWGIAVFEAMASGLPVLVSKTSGASEILTDGENALIFDPKSPNKIREGVERLCNNAQLYESISQNGRKFVEQNVSWGKYTDEMEKLFFMASGKK